MDSAISSRINHGNGYSTRYAHNEENLVAVGEEVRKGQTVALMGETGTGNRSEPALRGAEKRPAR